MKKNKFRIQNSFVKFQVIYYMSIRILFRYSFLSLLLIGCNSSSKTDNNKKKNLVIENKSIDSNIISITDSSCYGTYKGVEFNDALEKADLAHQFSNSMCQAVGDQLKKMYLEGKFSKVNFDHIIMITKGMNDGDNYVEYTLLIPFVKVKSKCEATTAFDHSGGWNHYPAIQTRKKVLLNKERTSSVDRKLDISQLKTTKEGLQEFWIQWKHKDYQKECK